MSKTYWGFPPIIVKEAHTKGRANANNNAFRIRIWKGIDYPAGTLMQELYEWHSEGKYQILFMALAFASVGLSFTGLPSALVLFIALGFMGLAVAWRFLLDRAKREIFSHTIEAVIAEESYVWAFHGAVAKEARSMEGSKSYPWLDGWTFEEIQEAMLAQEGKARKWVSKRRKLIAKWQGRLS